MSFPEKEFSGDSYSIRTGADAAASYMHWLKAEVQAALDDASPTVPHEEAMRQVRAAIKR